ncbi:MAG: hypothetical protein GY735_18445 [Delftia sp.]|nr:hypothetical protein [Delftia sp.]
MNTPTTTESLLSVLLPTTINLYFSIADVKDHKHHINIRLEELPELLPKDLSGVSSIVLDGFCNPIELQTFPLKGKPVYLKLYRRRWKQSGNNKQHYSNNYDLHPD